MTAQYSTCGRIGCYGIKTPGWALRCQNCGNSAVVFHGQRVAAAAAPKQVAA